MFRTWRRYGAALALGLASAVVTTACTSSQDEFGDSTDGYAAFGAAAAPEPAIVEKVVGQKVREVPVERVVAERKATEAVSPVFAAMPTPAPAPMFGLRPGGPDDPSPGATLSFQLAAAAAQERIIVRTVDISMEVDQIAEAIGAVSEIAQGLGGWVVASQRSASHSGSVSVRVPAERLDGALADIRALATRVESEVSTSQDFTDEYSDTTARLRTLEATEGALLKLFDRAVRVEDAIQVQTELTKVQQDIELLKGRLTLLEQTSAFSLVSVRLSAVPSEMPVDGGADVTLAVDRSDRFRATFTPPEGMEDFEITWDFGDGTPPVTLHRTAPTLDEGTLITAPVSHAYRDETDSPYIVKVEVRGTGEEGVAKGEDTVIATVSRLPVVEVFAGQNRSVEAGLEVEFLGSFTRPEGLSQVKLRWDFGDGTPPAEAELEEGTTTAATGHVYANHRPFPYTATLTITGKTEAGEAKGESSLLVLVSKAPALGAELDAGGTSKDAVRTIASIGAGMLRALIWTGILSVIWVPLGAVAVWLLMRRRRAVRT